MNRAAKREQEVAVQIIVQRRGEKLYGGMQRSRGVQDLVFVSHEGYYDK